MGCSTWDDDVYCRVVDGNRVGKFVGGGVGGLVWTYCPDICPESKRKPVT